MAGLICGERTGVAPASRLVSVLALTRGHGRLSDFITALEWAASQPEVAIINMSAGLPGFLPELMPVVERLLTVGVLPVFPTGNEGAGRTRSPGNYENVLSVGACDQRGAIAPFSGSGRPKLEGRRYAVPNVVAPGVNVTSCAPDGTYRTSSGTSLSAALITGVAALMLERWPGMSTSDLVHELVSTAKPLHAVPIRQGAGLVQCPPRVSTH